MSDPGSTRDGARRTVVWAENVTKEHRHGLADLENVLLVNDRRNVRRMQHGVRGRVWAGCWSQLYIFLVATPLAAPVVFSSGRWWGTTREYGAGWAYPTAAIVSCVGIGVLGIFLGRWRRQRVRMRDGISTTIAVLYVVSTALALVFALGRANTYAGSIGWYVLPMWILLTLSVATVAYQVRSPANPAWDHLLARDRKRIDVRRIHPEDQAWLLEERERALRALAERGLLDLASLDELAARSLGELHLPTQPREN